MAIIHLKEGEAGERPAPPPAPTPQQVKMSERIDTLWSIQNLLETLHQLKSLKKDLTRGDLESAEVVEEGTFTCPACEGCGDCRLCQEEGSVEGKQYVNVDGVALNVLFSGIGDEFVLWEKFFKLVNTLNFDLLHDVVAAAQKKGILP